MVFLKKTGTTALALAIVLSTSFCLVECAFASQEHEHPACAEEKADHHHTSENDNTESNKHDAGTLCCSSLVAVKNTSNYLTDSNPAKDSSLFFVNFEHLVFKTDLVSKYQIKYFSGASPPQVFLLTHFTHAPPVSL